MNLRYLIIPVMFIQYGLASGEDKILEVPCQGGTLLIQPKIKIMPEGNGIHFVSTWPVYPSYVVIKSNEREYKAKIIAERNTSNTGFWGYFFTKNSDISSIRFDGCHVQWSD